MSVTFLTNEDKAVLEQSITQLSEEIAEKSTVYDTELDLQRNVNRNLNVTKYISKTENGVVATVNDDNSVSFAGIASSNFYLIATAADRKAAGFWLPPGTYTISDGCDLAYIDAYLSIYADANAGTVVQTIKGNPATFTIDVERFVVFTITVSKGDRELDGITLKPQLERGEKATAYVSPFSGILQSKRLAEIERKIDAIDGEMHTDVGIGYYFDNDYLPEKAARVNELGKTADDVFMIITDQHWERNAKKSPFVINALCENCHVPRMFNLGDMADTVRQDLADLMAANFDGDIHYVMGNHDYFRPAKGKGLAYAYDSGKPMQVGVRERHYYYVDNPQSKLRYIILSGFDEGVESGDSWTRGYEAAQLAWLATEALNVEAGWNVLVYMHSTHVISSDRLNVTADIYAAPVLELLDANNAEGKIIAIFSGHTHIDAVMHTTGGIPIIITACDKYQAYTSGDYFDFYDDDRLLGTITEQCFDVAAIDKTVRTINLVRIGAPAHDIVDGVNSGKVLEERVVTY